jgi:hypothetical protein
MFRRQLRIDVVKKTKTDPNSDEVESDLESAALLMQSTIKEGAKQVGGIVITYIVLDTIRQVVVRSLTP